MQLKFCLVLAYAFFTNAFLYVLSVLAVCVIFIAVHTVLWPSNHRRVNMYGVNELEEGLMGSCSARTLLLAASTWAIACAVVLVSVDASRDADRLGYLAVLLLYIGWGIISLAGLWFFRYTQSINTTHLTHTHRPSLDQYRTLATNSKMSTLVSNTDIGIGPRQAKAPRATSVTPHAQPAFYGPSEIAMQNAQRSEDATYYAAANAQQQRHEQAYAAYQQRNSASPINTF